MSWIVLVVSGLFEAVWAVALSESDGFRNVAPTVVFVVALILSMAGLAFALRDLPVGTGYVVWVGIGAVTTAVWGMAVQGDPVTTMRLVCLLAILAGVVGLQLTTD